LVERSLDEIALKIITPAPTEAELEEERKRKEEEERLKKEEEERAAEEAANAKAGKKAKQPPAPAKGAAKVEEPPAEEEEEKEVTPPEPEPSPSEAKAALSPPQDPWDSQVLHENLLVPQDGFRDMLKFTMDKFLDWVFQEKSSRLANVKRQGKDLIDASVDELDENLRA
jgi:hypothetical protein